MPLSRFPHDQQAEAIIRAYQLAGRDITQLLKDMASGAVTATVALTRIQQVLLRLGRLSETEARELIVNAVSQADQRALKLVPRRLPLKNRDLPTVQKEAVDHLTNSLLDGLAEARTSTARQARNIIQTVTRQESLQALLGNENANSRLKVNERVLKQLRDKKITGFVDKAGRNWKLDNYVDMLTRTITREAVTEGALARYAAHDIELIQISTHSTSCPVCGPLQGQIMRIDGGESPVDGISISPLQLPPFHPRCRHVVLPYVT